MKTIAVYNIKGGVGKTAAAVNLSYFAAKEGVRTLIWDLDPQGAASFYFKVKPKVKGGTKKLIKAKELENLIKETEIENLDILPADFSYRHMDIDLDDTKKSKQRISLLLEQVKDDYDLIFLDAPPNISLVSENIFYAANYMVIPVIPTTLSLRTYDQIVKYFLEHELKDVTLLPFFSMADRRKNMHKDIMSQGEHLMDNCLKNVIPYASTVENMGLYRQPVGEYASRSIAARAYRELWEEIKAYCSIEHLTTLPKIFGTKKKK